jgi:hypothetical protein
MNYLEEFNVNGFFDGSECDVKIVIGLLNIIVVSLWPLWLECH